MLTVENTGEQLTPQLVSTLTEPFQRGTERIRTDHAGVGLGLAIVKSITQAHDGTLTLTPRAGGGLSSRCSSPRNASRDARPGAATDRRILGGSLLLAAAARAWARHRSHARTRFGLCACVVRPQA